MVILEKPYISDDMTAWLAESGHPVLDNATARECARAHPLVLVPEDAFARRVNAGEHLYTTNENALDWVYHNIHNDGILRATSLMKDKAATRRALQPLYPDYRFSELSLDQMKMKDPDTLPYPFVLKPSVGFFSVGVYIVRSPDEWKKAVADIIARREEWSKVYSGEVVGNELFILEEVIAGDEYAIDAYFDEAGKPIIVNILRHEFSSADDVSDRLYYTGPAIIREKCRIFTEWLAQANAHLNIRSFPVHVEVRTDGKAIIPIEFNPLRFAGLCTTDLSYFAYGFFTYALYLNNRRPDWDAILGSMNDDIFSMIILDKPKTDADGLAFDYTALRARFADVRALREYHGDALPIYGFLFTRTPASRRAELDEIMRSDLREFLR